MQALVAWRVEDWRQQISVVLGWAAALMLAAVLRPRTAPKDLLVLYAIIAISQGITITHLHLVSNSDYVLRALPIVISLFAVLIIVNMPLRDPRLPRDEISPLFSTPTFELRSPEDDLTLWQFLSVSWMAPLIALGTGRQLNDEDVWYLPFEFQHTLLHETFREVQGSVIGRLIWANIIDIVFLSVLGVIDLLANLAIPVLLQQLLRAMENPSAPITAAITYAVLSLVVRIITAQTGILSLWYGRRCYERSRGEIITMLYEKTLNRRMIGVHEKPEIDMVEDDDEIFAEEEERVSTTEQAIADNSSRKWFRNPFKRKADPVRELVKEASKESASMGKVLNLLRGDAYEVAQRFWEVQSLVTKPLGLVFAVVLIWQLLGWPSLVGVLAILIGQAFNALFARKLIAWERVRRMATDAKLQKVSQFVESIRHLRWYGWQTTWCEEILDARQKELSIRIITGLWTILITFTNELSSGMFFVVAFYAYTVLAGKELRIDIVFPALQVFSILETNLREIPGLITVVLNARVAMGRIQAYMDEPDLEPDANFVKQKPNEGPNYSDNGNSQCHQGVLDTGDSGVSSSATRKLNITNGSFAWPGAYKNVLTDVSLEFETGLTVICGEVGSGKTALLQALLGELDTKSGSVQRSSEIIGYCAQTPWLQSMSIRDNILFSAPYDEVRYRKVLEACALTTDMANFKHGDLSFIGENGVGLSGGQRARVALARAIYSNAQILLLDDPISALDHQTAEYIVKNCITGELTKDRTVVLVTHRTEFCRGFSEKVVEVKDGRVSLLDLQTSQWEVDSGQEAKAPPQTTRDDKDLEDENPNKFMEDEFRAHGGVQSKIYWEYVKAGKLKVWLVLVILLILFQGVRVGQSWFLEQWGDGYSKQTSKSSWRNPFDRLPPPDVNIKPWLVGFAFLALIRSIMLLLASCCMLAVVYFTGQQMFQDVMKRISHSTFRFYDITPVGRLMNRLTSDINTIDGNISGQFQMFAQYSIAWVMSLVIIGSITPIFLAFSLALTSAFVFIFLHFLPTSQSLRRLEMVSLSPLMSNFGALVHGLTTIRAFCAQHRFQRRVISVTDNFQKMDHFYWSLQAWLMYRFDVLSAASTLALTLIAIYTGVSAGLTAFVLVAATNLVSSTHALCRTYGQLQMDFVSVERVVELLHLEQEKPGSVQPPAYWPSQSEDIIFEGVTIRYAPHLDPSLFDLNLRIPSGSTTAVIGRTGSGKSTLAMALLATIQPSSGRITIDNIDLAAVNVQTLRERITFVAQDPVLFPGTMRQNLDPLNEYSDTECKDVLEKIAGKFGWTLEFGVEAGGRNLSQGQRQLVGVARTILRRSEIVILDEVSLIALHRSNRHQGRNPARLRLTRGQATASIDLETAEAIQDVLHTEMKGKTVITVAHRLEAVKNANYCVVLDKGKVIQQGSREEVLASAN